ncbi:Major facilitator superfamily, partial [Globisporangium splendens]
MPPLDEEEADAPVDMPLSAADEAKELLQLREPHATCRSRGDHGVSGSSRHSCRELEEMSATKRRRWVLFSIIGGLIYGYNVSLAAPLQYIRDDLQLTASQEEIISATATLSDASSMLVGGYLADTYGRKYTALFACACSIFGALLASVFSTSFVTLFVWRLISGVGNGLSILLIPMYISESVGSNNRGTFLTLFQLGVNSGCAFPYLFMILVNENWRSCLAFGCLPALYVFYNFHVHFPESIKWLRWKENPLEYDLEDGSSADSNADDEDEITTRNSSLSGSSASPHHQLSIMSARPRPHLELCIGILLAYVNNCVDASLFYGPEIIAKTIPDYTRKDANIFGLLCSLVAVVSVLFAARFLIDKYPRRQLYLLCLAVVCVCFLLSGVIFARYSTEDFAQDAVASTSVMVTFAVLNIFAAIGPSILFVVVLSELFQDSSYRARYMSYCTFAMSLISLLVNGSLLTLFESFGTSATFIGYGVTYVACLAFFWVYLPETKQRQLV